MAEKKSLKYFMHKMEDAVVTVPGPKSFVDENGNVINLEIKCLSKKEIDDINDKYKNKSIATDKKGNPLVMNGEVIWKTDRDNRTATQMIMVKALQYPDLNDKELMDYYKCVDVTEMPKLVFSSNDDYNYVLTQVMIACGLIDKDETDVDAAKN